MIFLYCILSSCLCGLVIIVLATYPEIRVRFPDLPDFFLRVGLERGPLSLLRIIEELGKTSDSGFRKARLTAMGNRCTDHAAPTIRKGWYLLTSGGHSAGVVRLRTKATEFKYCHLLLFCHIIISVLLYYYYYHLLLYCHIIKSVHYYSYYYIILILCINLDLSHIIYNDSWMK
jgi:hypothetical protein